MRTKFGAGAGRGSARLVLLGERFAARLGMDKAELEVGFGDFEHLAASLFAFSARFEIGRDDRIVGRGKGPNSGRERDSLIRAKLSLIARFNSL